MASLPAFGIQQLQNSINVLNTNKHSKIIDTKYYLKDPVFLNLSASSFSKY